MESLAKHLGAAIWRVRTEQAELTQEQLAERIGVHRTYVGTIERGMNVTIDMLARVASALDVRPSSLLAEAEESASKPAKKRR